MCCPGIANVVEGGQADGTEGGESGMSNLSTLGTFSIAQDVFVS